MVRRVIGHSSEFLNGFRCGFLGFKSCTVLLRLEAFEEQCEGIAVF